MKGNENIVFSVCIQLQQIKIALANENIALQYTVEFFHRYQSGPSKWALEMAPQLSTNATAECRLTHTHTHDTCIYLYVFL